jgi:hypothetical protein
MVGGAKPDYFTTEHTELTEGAWKGRARARDADGDASSVSSVCSVVQSFAFGRAHRVLQARPRRRK